MIKVVIMKENILQKKHQAILLLQNKNQYRQAISSAQIYAGKNSIQIETIALITPFLGSSQLSNCAFTSSKFTRCVM